VVKTARTPSVDSQLKSNVPLRRSILAEVYLSDTYHYGIPSVAFTVSAVVTSTKVRCPSRFNSSPALLRSPTSSNVERQLEILLNIRPLCTTYRATYRGKLLATAVKWSTHCYGPWHIAKANTRKRKFLTVDDNYVSVSIVEKERKRSVLEAFFVAYYAIGK